MYILVWLLILIPSAFGSSLESTYLQALSRAPDGSSVAQLLKAYEQLKVARTACKIQLRAATIPVACYQTLALETNLRLHKPPRERQALLLRLDSLCQQAALSLAVQSATPPFVSKNCRQWMLRAGEVARYRQHTTGSAE